MLEAREIEQRTYQVTQARIFFSVNLFRKDPYKYNLNFIWTPASLDGPFYSEDGFCFMGKHLFHNWSDHG